MARLSRRMLRTRFPVAKTDSQPRSPEVGFEENAIDLLQARLGPVSVQTDDSTRTA
jgi:hypothetical protein